LGIGTLSDLPRITIPKCSLYLKPEGIFVKSRVTKAIYYGYNVINLGLSNFCYQGSSVSESEIIFYISLSVELSSTTSSIYLRNSGGILFGSNGSKIDTGSLADFGFVH